MPGFDQTTQPPGVGRTLSGRYRLVAPIARGGMAEVWEGHDEVLSRPVAVKVLQAHLAADGVFLERFRREAVTAARLAHPGIVSTFDTGVDQGTAFIVMELVRGRNLRQWLNEHGRMDPAGAVSVTRQVADALAYAHQAGLVHRDVKPANVLLIEDEWGGLRVKVTDFGIAKAGLDAGADLTRTGMVLGTPKYLSPEQIKGRDPDARADLYSLGVVLYETLVGEPPYVGETDMATALAHLSDRVPKPSSSVRGIPHALDRVVVDLLAKSPDRRIQSAQDLRQRLDSLGPLPSGLTGDTRRRGVRRRGSDPGALSGGAGTGSGSGYRSGSGGPNGWAGFPAAPTVTPSAGAGGPYPGGGGAGAGGSGAGAGGAGAGAGGAGAGGAGAVAGGPRSPRVMPAPVDPGPPTMAAPVVDPTAVDPPLDPTAAAPRTPPTTVTGADPTRAFSAGPPPPPPPAVRAAPAGRTPPDGEPYTPVPAQGHQPSGTDPYQAGGPYRAAAPYGSDTYGSDTYGSGFPAAGGSHTDELAGPAPARRNHRTERRVGLVVLGLVIVGALVAAGLLTSGSHPASSGNGSQPTAAPGSSGSAKHISGVSVYLSVTGHTLDNPGETPRTFDGNPSTYWQSAVYTSPRFGNLYPGIGLVIDLGSASNLHHLAVTSPTTGWSASTYVGDNNVGVGQPLSDWGKPTAARSGIGGNATFSLAGRHGQYVMLWITDLGPANTIKVAELSVS